MTFQLEIPVSIGELYDKYSILEIKENKFTNIDKIKYVKFELSELKPFIDKYKLDSNIYKELKEVNLELWNIEDEIRIKEKNNEFDEKFISLARSVYITNDRRCDIKREINMIFNSSIIECKEYTDYNSNSKLINTSSNNENINLINKLINDGNKYKDKKNYNKALECYNNVLELDTNNFTVYYNIGLVYTELKLYEIAIFFYKKSIEINPKLEQAYNNIGGLYSITYRFKQSVEYLT